MHVAIENPRVAGSIPSLATISNLMIRNGFWASAADRPWPSMADPRTIGKWVGAVGNTHDTCDHPTPISLAVPAQ